MDYIVLGSRYSAYIHFNNSKTPNFDFDPDALKLERKSSS